MIEPGQSPPADRAVRTVIADDHPVYREGLARMFHNRPEFELVGECADGKSALAAIRAAKPDVALLDVWLPDLNGIDVLRTVRDEGNISLRVLMLSVSDDPATVYEAIAAGASGYLLKNADHGTICDAVLSARGSATMLTPDLMGALARHIRAHEDRDRHLLSVREQEVLRLASQGLSTREIATTLFLSPATIKTHLQHTYAKLEVSDRASAVAEGIRRGFIG